MEAVLPGSAPLYTQAPVPGQIFSSGFSYVSNGSLALAANTFGNLTPSPTPVITTPPSGPYRIWIAAHVTWQVPTGTQLLETALGIYRSPADGGAFIGYLSLVRQHAGSAVYIANGMTAWMDSADAGTDWATPDLTPGRTVSARQMIRSTAAATATIYAGAALALYPSSMRWWVTYL